MNKTKSVSIWFIVILIALVFVVKCANAATNYYMSPSGSNANDGLTTGAAWATLQYAREFSPALGADDTLFIMGGTYSTAQYWQDEGGTCYGTSGSPLVIKAYGDSKAIFVNAGGYQQYFEFSNSACDYIVVDGFSYQSAADSLYIKLESHEDSGSMIDAGSSSLGDPADYIEGLVIKGIEIDGSNMNGFTGGADELWSGIRLDHIRKSTIASNYIHHCHHPTGPIPPGDDTENHQSSGYGIYLRSSELVTIEKNVLKYMNHGAIYLEVTRGVSLPSGHACRYNKIQNNFIENYYGGGIFISTSPLATAQPQHHNLIEGNIITHCGETLYNSKSAIQLGGSNNVVRKNVIYNPMNEGISLEGQVAIGFKNIVENNLIYNNVVFGCRQPFYIVVKAVGCAECAVENNLIANNIFHKKTASRFSWMEAMIVADLYHSDGDHNWFETCDATGTPHETHWGGNVFKNNIIYKNTGGTLESRMVSFGPDADCYNNWYYYSLRDLQIVDPTAWWTSNSSRDPVFASENPDGYGLQNEWWKPCNCSQVVNFGVAIDDTLGTYVEGLYEGYGWDTLTYYGGAPDIGAYEYAEEEEVPAVPRRYDSKVEDRPEVEW